MKIKGGYVIMPRFSIDSEIFAKPPLYIKVWHYLLARAQHTDYKGLKRGQLRTSIPEIIEGCSWKVGYRKVKPTKAEVYRVIEWLRKSDERNHERNTNETAITTTKATHGMVITIDNYSVYQDPKNYERNNGSNDENDTNGLRNERGENNINKNDKNDKNKEVVVVIDDEKKFESDASEKEKTHPEKREDPFLDQLESNDDYDQVQHLYLQRAGKTMLSGADMNCISRILDHDKIPLQTILDGINQAFDNYKPQRPNDKIRSFSYCAAVIQSLHDYRLKREDWNKRKKKRPLVQRKPNPNELPEVFRKKQNEPKSQISKEEMEAKRKALLGRLKIKNNDMPIGEAKP